MDAFECESQYLVVKFRSDPKPVKLTQNGAHVTEFRGFFDMSRGAF